MQQEIIKSDRLGEQYYRYRHPTGLTVLLYPMAGFQTTYALFGTNYGSIDNCFKRNEEDGFVHVPDGIAHFLEHKLFESEDGDAFTLFAKTGADANAYTSFDKTCYLFSCTDQFSESLKALLTFVQSPYFTQKTVEKEQGIIGQEIRMYDDSPGWQVMFGLLQCLYENSPVKVDIAGTVKSIAQIDAELLYKCYHTFYNLSNMVLSISGHFDIEEAKAVIEECLKPSEPIEITRAPYNEPDAAIQKETSKKMDVSLPLFYFGYKVRPEEDPHASLAQQYELEILLDVLVGSTSDFFEEQYESGLLNDSFGTEVFGGRGFLATLFGGESRNPKVVLDAFLKIVETAKKTGISEEDFLSCKNAIYGKSLKVLGDVESCGTSLLSAEMMGVGMFEIVEVLAAVTLEDVNRRLATSFAEEALALSVIEPNQAQ